MTKPSPPQPFYRGKVRDLYEVDDHSMILLASDRLSAFDVVFQQPIPDKGRMLSTISTLWFQALRRAGLEERLDFDDHWRSDQVADFPAPYNQCADWQGRAVLVARTRRVDFECVVRGYLAGSGWKDYQRTGTVCGHALPAGLELASRLPEPIFTPATKAPLGEHDENVTVATMERSLGVDLTRRLERISLAIYEFARDRMATQGILLCDTKFEFGLSADNRLVLIDEALTPDSSRYWDTAAYRPGQSPPGFDKQFVRDYVENLGWNKRPPAPLLPAAVLEQTAALYREIEGRIRRALVDLIP